MGQGHGSQNTKQPPEKQGPEEKRGGDGLNGGQWSRKGRAGTEASSLNLRLSWERCTVSPEYIQSVHGLCTRVTCTSWGHWEIKRVVLLLETGSPEPSTEVPGGLHSQSVGLKDKSGRASSSSVPHFLLSSALPIPGPTSDCLEATAAWKLPIGSGTVPMDGAHDAAGPTSRLSAFEGKRRPCVPLPKRPAEVSEAWGSPARLKIQSRCGSTRRLETPSGALGLS